MKKVDKPQQTDADVNDTQPNDSGNTELSTKNWKDVLIPEEIKELPLFDKYKTPQDVFKAFAEAQKLIGKKGIIPPDNDSDEAQKKEFWKNVYTVLGDEYPEDPNEYELPEMEEIPEDIPIDENVVNSFKEVAHKLNLSKGQVKELYQWYMDNLVNSYNRELEGAEALRIEAENNLKKKWGKAYNENLKLAQQVVSKFGTEGLLQKINSGLGNDPDLIETFSQIGKVLSEDILAGTGRRYMKTPEEAREEIKKIRMDLKHPFNIETHPEHKQAVEYVQGLYKLAYPDLTEET